MKKKSSAKSSKGVKKATLSFVSHDQFELIVALSAVSAILIFLGMFILKMR